MTVLKIYGLNDAGCRLINSFTWEKYGATLSYEEREDSTYNNHRHDLTILGNFKIVRSINDDRLRISPAACNLGYAALDKSMYYYVEVSHD